MKFKIGDKVKVIRANPSWLNWVSEMNTVVGQTLVVVGEWDNGREVCPTLVVSGYCSGLCSEGRVTGEYGFPDDCLELALQPGEQLEFAFMHED